MQRESATVKPLHTTLGHALRCAKAALMFGVQSVLKSLGFPGFRRMGVFFFFFFFFFFLCVLFLRFRSELDLLLEEHRLPNPEPQASKHASPGRQRMLYEERVQSGDGRQTRHNKKTAASSKTGKPKLFKTLYTQKQTASSAPNHSPATRIAKMRNS